jgi:hypothetical protein
LAAFSWLFVLVVMVCSWPIYASAHPGLVINRASKPPVAAELTLARLSFTNRD